MIHFNPTTAPIDAPIQIAGIHLTPCGEHPPKGWDVETDHAGPYWVAVLPAGPNGESTEWIWCQGEQMLLTVTYTHSGDMLVENLQMRFWENLMG